jgi:outer membrane protein
MMKKRTWISLLALLVVSVTPAAPGQETLVLTLDDCLKMVLNRNPFVLATLEKESGAKAQVRQAAAGFFPSLSGQGTDILDKKVFTLEFPSLIPGEPPQKIQVDFTKTYTLALNFSMPIFTGGLLTSTFKQANYNFLATKEAGRQTRQETAFNVKKTFYGCLLAGKFRDVSEEAVALAERHREKVKNLYDAGMASRFDLLRSEVQVANLKPQLIRARNQLEISELALKTLLGLDLGCPIELKGALSFVPLATDVDEAVRRALDRRPELEQLRYQRKMAGEMVKMARASGLPSLAIGGAYNFWSNSMNLRNKNWESYYSVNLVLNVPLFSGFSVDAKIGQSKAAQRELELTLKGLSETVRFEVRQAVLNYKQSKESLDSQEKNVEQAQEAVRIAELNYAEGLVTNLDVSSAQVALSQAKTNLAQALYDCMVSLAELDKAIGENSGLDEAR